MKRKPFLLAVISVVALLMYAQGRTEPRWRVFANRAGWSIRHPASWSIASCRSCNDPKAADVYVDFFPPRMKTADGWVMVEPLAEKPSDTSVDAWLTDISSTANLCPHLEEQKLTVNGLPALRVRYRTADEQEMEQVYVVSGSRTFSVEFSGDSRGKGRGVPLEKLGNYQTYLKMLSTFGVDRP